MSNVDLSALRFLLAEDNAHMRRIVRMLLTGYGAREVYEAEDGAVALEIFNSQLPDIVITDWSMPVFDGIELTRMIRNVQSSANPYVPIVMMTGHSEKRKVIEARDAGVTEFLCKPIAARDLYARIINATLNPRPFIRTASFFGPDRRRFVNPLYKGDERRGDEIAKSKDEQDAEATEAVIEAFAESEAAEEAAAV